MRSRSVLALVLLASCAASAFSQRAGPHGGATPIGHEYITMRSALEVIAMKLAPRRKGGAVALHPDAPGAVLDAVKAAPARAEDDDGYGAKYDAVLSAVYGQRWVDVAGVDVAEALALGAAGRGADCFDGIAQNPDEVQYDHFLRRRSDVGAAGALRAIKESSARFKAYFVAAAQPQPAGTSARMRVRDGGLRVNVREVDRAYFLLGRALHLFEDSFSPEHAVRSSRGGWRKLEGVKTYVCTAGSDRHNPHGPLTAGQLYTGDRDIIWNNAKLLTGVNHWKFADLFLHDEALAAIEATKDVWAAFFRVQARDPSERAAAASKEADLIVRTWLTADEKAVRARYPEGSKKPPKGVELVSFTDQPKCDAEKLEAGPVTFDELVKAIRIACMSNIRTLGPSSDRDPHLFNMPYDWDKVMGFEELQVKVRGHSVSAKTGKQR